MKYIEIIILVNVLIHVCFVKLSYYLMNLKINHCMTIISSFIDGGYIIFYLLYPYEIESYKYLFIFIISFSPFITKGLSKGLGLMLVYLMLNFSLGGGSEFLYHIINHFISVIICIFFIFILLFIYNIYRKYHVNLHNLEYDILIKHDKKTYKMRGFYDTGNFLFDDDNIPIIFLNNKFIIGKYVKKISVKTVSCMKEVSLYSIDSFKIKINNKFISKDVYIAYSDIVFDVMFGSNLLGG